MQKWWFTDFFFAVSKDFQDLCLRVKVAFMRDPFFHTETDFMASASLAGSCVLEIFLVAHVLSSLKWPWRPSLLTSQGQVGHITFYSGQSSWASLHLNLSWVGLYRCSTLRLERMTQGEKSLELWKLVCTSLLPLQQAYFISQAGESRAGRIHSFTIRCQWPGRQVINIPPGLWVGGGRKHMNHIIVMDVTVLFKGHPEVETHFAVVIYLYKWKTQEFIGVVTDTTVWNTFLNYSIDATNPYSSIEVSAYISVTFHSKYYSTVGWCAGAGMQASIRYFIFLSWRNFLCRKAAGHTVVMAERREGHAHDRAWPPLYRQSAETRWLKEFLESEMHQEITIYLDVA